MVLNVFSVALAFGHYVIFVCEPLGRMGKGMAYDQ